VTAYQYERRLEDWADEWARLGPRLRSGEVSDDDVIRAIRSVPVHYALPDYLSVDYGTAIVWGEAGASGVTNTLTLDALASGSARMGAEADLGADHDDEFNAELRIESGTAPTAGGTVELYLACSSDGTNYPAGVTGSDGAWPSDGNEDEWRLQLGPPVVVLVATNDGNVLQVGPLAIWRPAGRYVAPVVDNNWSQAVRDEATATNNDSRVILTPRRLFVGDAAA
jgi:hypothetical protein